jgi:hypothetical protein
MRIHELVLSEAREAPLYHFTSQKKFLRILDLDSLLSQAGRIYFTRDYSRQFLPHKNEMMTASSWGLRLDQNLLYQHYGKLLKPAGQPGADRSKSRWESEEHLETHRLPNLHRYLTGFVLTKENGFSADSARRSSDSQHSEQDLVSWMIQQFPGREGFLTRNQIMDYAVKFNIPFVYQRVEMPAAQVRQAVIKYYVDRKAERARPQNSYTLQNNTKGYRITASSAEAAIEWARENSHRFPTGLLAIQDADGEVIQQFDPPLVLNARAPR